MKSHFRSSNLILFLSLYDSICQIPFDRFRDKLQLETVQNGTAVKIGKKRESVYEALGYLKFIFACVALFY